MCGLGGDDVRKTWLDFPAELNIDEILSEYDDWREVETMPCMMALGLIQTPVGGGMG